jgi:hypothetical protein
MMTRNFTVFVALALLGALFICSAKQAAAPANYRTDPFFSFNMDLQPANDTVAGKDWKIIYRVDTPSTNEIAAVYQEATYYHLGFFHGKCYMIEKRTQLPLADVQKVFTSMGNTLGQTPEATQSDDGSLIFSRWTLRDREISLTADKGSGDIYKLTYEEEDPMAAGEAIHTQEQEVMANTKTTIDPITGLPKLVPNQGQPDDQQAQGDANGDSKSDAKDGKDSKDDKDAKGDDSKSKDDDSSKKKKDDPQINHDDPNDW